jgi:hypothetical protein
MDARHDCPVDGAQSIGAPAPCRLTRGLLYSESGPVHRGQEESEWSGRHSTEQLMEASMEATTIAVIVLLALFVGGMTTLMIILNKPEKK